MYCIGDTDTDYRSERMAGKDMEYIAGRDMEYITGERMDAGAYCPADSSRAGTDPAGGFETGVSVA